MRAKNWAHVMARLCEGADGSVEPERVSAVCEYVSQNFAQEKSLKTLRLLERYLESKIERDCALVESAGALSAESKSLLEAFVKSKNSRARVDFAENPELIAGVRVRIGDSLWENSVKQKLRDLAQTLGA